MLPRIIPARAGFTAQIVAELLPGQDHPRSRGVYALSTSARTARRGSSPLVRGLPRPPASRWPGPTDHPRSRGVYPMRRSQHSRRTRIIPARAGFTRNGGRGFETLKDHPRSRGVYPRSRSTSSSRRGSSPLARGLQQVAGVDVGQLGIIPARAGFTRRECGWRPWRSDHPRSRGVYSLSMFKNCTWKGSSPLARGLRRHLRHLRDSRRIIPARAGFTRRRHGRIPHGGDHPRSRGVYPIWRG